MMPTLFLNMYPMVMLQKVNLNGTLFLGIKVLQGGGLCKQVLSRIADNDMKTKSEIYSNYLIWVMPAKGLKSKRGLRYIRSLFLYIRSAKCMGGAAGPVCLLQLIL
jgi:hypothetical protein